jgi:hypothetical protein
MQFNITVTDPLKLLGFQRALDAQNAARSTPLSAAEFLQGLVDDQISGFVAAHLIARIEPFDFLNRFTAAERVAIRTAAQTNGAIADYVAMLDAAPSVVLTDPLTMGGVQALEAAGLIGAGRAAEILAL